MKTRRLTILTFIAALALLTLSGAWASALARPLAPTAVLASSTFDTDAEGWTVIADADGPTHHSTGGNPDGYISAADRGEGGFWYWDAPAKFLGNKASAYGETLRFDLRQSTTELQFDADDVVLIGGGITLTFDTPDNPGTDWTSYSISLTETAGWLNAATGFSPTAPEMQAVLADLTALQIRGEFSEGMDIGGLDNVVLEGVAALTYSTTGRVTDGSSSPISGVIVSAGAGGSASTNASGYYTITGVVSGTYTLTPSKSGCTFSPPSRNVSVPPDATGQDFTGTCGGTPPTPTCAVSTTLVSINTGGNGGNLGGGKPDISADGRYVAFVSGSDDLVSDDTNGATDVFVRDRQAGQTSRVSVATGGAQATGNSDGWGKPSISADGRYVAFISEAKLDGDTNDYTDIFVHDRTNNETVRVSVASGGTSANSESDWPAISGNGRYVTFWSAASNLVADDNNDALDIFVHDLQTHQTTRIANVFGIGDISHGGFLDISYDGRYVAFATSVALVSGDGNSDWDVYVYDRQASQSPFSRVSLATSGDADVGSRDPSMSADGRYVAFVSSATNLVSGDNNNEIDIFLRDRLLGKTVRVSVSSTGAEANGNSGMFDELGESCSISADGRFVTFTSDATNLVDGDTNSLTDIYVHDAFTHQTSRVSVAWNGAQATGASGWMSISGDGRYAAFGSEASNLVSNDGNSYPDAFVHSWCPVELKWVYLPVILRLR